MTIKQQICGLLDLLPESKIVQIYDYVRFLTNEQFNSDIPSADTLAAFEEGNKLIKEGKARFNNADEMFSDLGI